MQTATRLENIQEQEQGAGPCSEPCSLALGAFDGLHRGHMAVIREAMKAPFSAGVLTFTGSPQGSPGLITPEEKEEILREEGVSRLYSLDFSKVKNIPAEEFFWDTLQKRCMAKRLCCGEDFRFGQGAKGDAALLQDLCKEAGAELVILPNLMENGEKISSTGIRAAVQAGDIPAANCLLGRPFGFKAEVIHGNHLGRELGFPTVNQALPEHFTLPPFGVYASQMDIGGGKKYGVTNIGMKPTVGSDRVLAETWILDFSGDLYGKKIRLSLLKFIRPERKFNSLEELKAEVLRNGEQARKIAENWEIDWKKAAF